LRLLSDSFKKSPRCYILQSLLARPKKMIAGYAIGIICGMALSLLLTGLPFAVLSMDYDFIPLTAGAIAVGLSIFLMTITANEHPPAAGVALSFAVSGWEWETIGFILLFAIMLSIVKRLLGRFMVNLF
jgi:CBS-domain-containing membrane protein